MKAVLFDLDDTLYPEIDFVRSGFRAVDAFFAKRYNFSCGFLYDQMLNILNRDGRGSVFNTLLEDLGLFSIEKLNLMIYLYRSHLPSLKLYDEAIEVLEKFKKDGLGIGIITDGMASVQKNKIKSLGLESFVDIILYTDKLGREFWKPSVVPFQIALEIIHVEPQDAIYVGDNREKDFLGPNSIGMTSVYINRQSELPVADKENLNKALPSYVIANLKDLYTII
ncbi:haloacid dehalogenase [Candidatus Magnetoovum chiemensis]|nr:haloacid dehalogenase [Candidatus Magnetoovum chiemensis]